MTGFELAAYDVVELIGFGGTGEVWLGREKSSGQPVALKRLRGPADLAGRDRLRREAAVLTGVRHPHVVRLRTVVSAGDDMVLVLDHAPGGSLARLLAGRSTVRPGEVVTIAVPLARALAAVHAAGVVHGDVAPGNVLFAADGRPLLSDLGVCRLMGDTPTDVMGTHGFVAPEVLAGEPTTPASDVFGLGAVCRAALGSDAPVTMTRALQEATDPDPGRRPSAAALARAMFDAVPAVPVRVVGAAAAAVGDPAEGTRAELRDVPVGLAPHVTHRVRQPSEAPDQPAPGPDLRRGSGRRGSGRRARGRAASALEGRALGAWDSGVGRRRGAATGAQGRRAAAREPCTGPAHRWRALAAVAAVAVGVTAAVGAGLLWAGAGQGGAALVPPAGRAGSAGSGSEPSGPEPSGRAGSAGPGSEPSASAGSGSVALAWSHVLRRLDAARSAAFATADPGALDRVYAPGSPAKARDAARVRELARSGATARRLRLDVHTAEAHRSAGSRVVLRVVDRMPPYDIVGPDGVVLATRPGRGDLRWSVTVVRVGGEWRVYDVARG